MTVGKLVVTRLTKMSQSQVPVEQQIMKHKKINKPEGTFLVTTTVAKLVVTRLTRLFQ